MAAPVGRRRLGGRRPRAPRLLTVTIPARFNGPPASAHGGYSCAVLALEVESPVVAVSLRSPPPLERAMALRREDGKVAMFDGDTLVAEAVPAELELDVPDAPTIDEAKRASERSSGWSHHPFPTCFGCGPERHPPDALRVLPGPVAGRPNLAAAPWTPALELAGEDGRVTPLFTWAALDCPTYFGLENPDARPQVLAQLTARLLARPQAGEPHVIVAWQTAADGRKRRGAAAIVALDGEVCGISEGLWIAPRDPASVGAAV